MAEYRVLYESQQDVIESAPYRSYRTYRIVGDSEPRIVVACPYGALGEVCGEVRAGASAAELAQAAVAADRATQALVAQGCEVHGTRGDVFDPAIAIDQLLEQISDEQLLGLAQQAFAERLSEGLPEQLAPEPEPGEPVESSDPGEVILPGVIIVSSDEEPDAATAG